MFSPWTVVFFLLPFLPIASPMHWNTVQIKREFVKLKENSTYWRDQAARRREKYAYRDMNTDDEAEPTIPVISLLRIFGMAYAMTQTIFIFLMMPEIYTDYIKTQDDDGANAIHLIDLPHLVVDKVREIEKDKEKEKEKTKEEEDVSVTKKCSAEKQKKKGKKAKKNKKKKNKKTKKTKKEDDTLELHTAPEEGSWIQHHPEYSPEVKMLPLSKERAPHSQRLPRASKGHQTQFLDDMEDYLMGEEAENIENETRGGDLQAKPADKFEKNQATERIHTAVEWTEDQSDVENKDGDVKSNSSAAMKPKEK